MFNYRFDPLAVLLNGSSLDDCGRIDDCLDKTSHILVFFLLKIRISANIMRARTRM